MRRRQRGHRGEVVARDQEVVVEDRPGCPASSVRIAPQRTVRDGAYGRGAVLPGCGPMASLVRRVLALRRRRRALAVVAVVVLFGERRRPPAARARRRRERRPARLHAGARGGVAAAAARGHAHVLYAKRPAGRARAPSATPRYRPLVEAAAEDRRRRARHARGDGLAGERRARRRDRRPAARGRRRPDADPRRDRAQPAGA